jgi:hypothetical protein
MVRAIQTQPTEIPWKNRATTRPAPAQIPNNLCDTEKGCTGTTLSMFPMKAESGSESGPSYNL